MKRTILILASVAVLLILVIAAIPFFVSADAFLPILQQQLTAALGRKVTLGNLSLNLFEGGLTANNLTIADDPAFSTKPFLQAKQLHVGVDLGQLLFHKQLHVTKLDIAHPAIQLLQAQNGRWNYSSLGNSGAKSSSRPGNSQAGLFSVDSMKIVNGQATVGTVPQLAAPRIYSQIDVSVDHFSFASQFPFKMTAHLPASGIVSLTGVAGPIDGADSALTPFHADLDLKHIDLVAAGFLDQQAGISGVLDAKAQMVSDGVTMTSHGQVVGNNMQFSSQGKPAGTPLKVDYDTSYNLASSIGNISRATLSAGPLTTNLNGTYQLLPAHPQVQLKVDGNNLSVDALQALLPAFGVKLPNGSLLQGGTLSTALAIDGPLNNLVITGPVSLSNTRLSGFNLGSKLAAISMLNSLSGGTGNVTEIQTFRADLRDTQQAITASNILAVVPSLGQATGSGTILPGGQLNFNMLAKLSSQGGLGAIATGVMSALPGLLGSRAATNGIPLTVRGTTSSPSFGVDTGLLGSSNNHSQPSPTNTLGNTLKGIFGSH